MRKLVITLAVLLALLVGADRIGAVIAADAVATKLQSAGSLSAKPSVSIRGFPFLTQAFSGRYDRIELSAHDVSRRTISLSRLDVVVLGARISLSEALRGGVTAVPVEGVTATAYVRYADIASHGGLVGATIEPNGDGVRVTARLTVLGQSVTATSQSTVQLVHDVLLITAQSISVQGQSSAAIDAAVRGQLDLRVSIGTLPYGLRLTGARAGSGAVVLTARTGATILVRP